LVAVSLGSLQYVLEEGPRNDWFESRAIVSLGAVAAVAGVLLVWREMTAAQPVVELRAFSDRNFSIGCFYSFVIGTGLYGAIYVLPLYMSQVRGYDSLEIGKTLIVTGLFQFLSAPIAGILAKRIDLRLMLASGLLLFGGGLWLNVAITSEWGFWELALPQAVRGGSLMLIFLPINTIALGRLPKSQLNNASGLYNLMRNLGGAIGLATLGTIIGERGDMHRLRLSEWITGGHLRATETLDTVSAALAPRLGDASNLAAIRVVDAIVRREALTMTFADALLLMSLVFIAALLLTPLLRGVAGKA
ncbi:MAG: MFS transporter, partial [Alphaproteobacteria bacterium]|nr:MFS transporter [Alphaproteobacteria bacterium]